MSMFLLVVLIVCLYFLIEARVEINQQDITIDRLRSILYSEACSRDLTEAADYAADAEDRHV